MKIKDLIAEAVSLPVEDRALVLDSLLKSLNSPETGIDAKWVSLAKQRLYQLRSGEAEVIPADKVFQKIWNNFN